MNLETEVRKLPQRLVTVIVPIHNMEDRLTNIFSWLCEADELNFQVILVCNGCTDDTKLQLEKFIVLHNLRNVLIVECEVLGPGNARNYGMTFIEGRFTLFWDSDDIGYPQKVFELINKEVNFDALVGRYSTNRNLTLSKSKLVSDAHSAKLQEFSANPGVWRCIFRSSSINNIQFGSSSMGEDQVFTARFLTTNPVIEFNSTTVYQYFTDVPNQLTAVPSNIKGLKRSVKDIYCVINKSPDNYLSHISTIYLKLLLTGIKRGNFTMGVRFTFRIILFLIFKTSKRLSICKKIKILNSLIFGGAHGN